MPARHPYQEGPDAPRQDSTGTSDVDRILDQTMRDVASAMHDVANAGRDVASAGRDLGVGVLGGLAEALGAVGDAFRSRGLEDKERPFADWRRLLDRKLKNDNQDGYLALAICGWTFTGCFGIAALVLGILSAAGAGALGITPAEYAALPVLTACFVPITIGFSVMGVIGGARYGYYARLRAYLRGARDWVSPVSELARGAGQPTQRAAEELQKAMVAGVLPGVAISPDGQTVYWDEARYVPEPPGPAPAAPQDDSGDVGHLQQEGAGFLRYLHACRGRLGDNADEQIEAMEKNCAALLAFARNHPEQAPRLRRFGEYYLPTTRKLLDTALGLGDTDTAEAERLRGDIAGVLHTLNLAYQKLYDNLLQDVRLDVSTEIDTLETMLRQDGLTHDFRQDFGADAGKNQ